MYSDTSGLSGLRGIIAVSSILLIPCLVIAFFTFRPAKPRHLRAAWYIVSLATLCLIGVHLTGIVVAALVWSHPNRSPYALDQYHINWQHDSLGPAVFKTVTLCSGLYSLLIPVACRVAFWEHTASQEFRRHNTARWISLAFDLLLGLAALGMLLSVTAVGMPCCEGSSQSAGDLLIGGIFDESFSYGFPYIVVCSYILVTLGAFFLRRWARRYNIGVPIAEAMFAFIPLALLVQTLCLIVLTVVYFNEAIHNDIIVFYASIPWRIQQIVVLGLLTWILRSRPLLGDNDQKITTARYAPQMKGSTLPAFA